MLTGIYKVSAPNIGFAKPASFKANCYLRSRLRKALNVVRNPCSTILDIVIMTKTPSLLLTLIILVAVFTHCSDTNADAKQSIGNSSVNHSEIKGLDSLKSLVEWVQQNEENIATSLRRAISKTDNMSPQHEYIEESIVVTEYDSSILGELARRVKLIDSTLEVNYTVKKGFTEKPVISPKATAEDGYTDLRWKADKRIELSHLIFEYADTLLFETKRQWN
jgi:hypothetical protein